MILTDSTVIRLHDFLAHDFPGCRTNHTKSALKAHAILSVAGFGKASIKVTGERAHDGPVFKVGKWVKDHVLLFDLGYFRYQLFACIHRNGGYFLTRLKANANPTIVAINRVHRGRAVPVVGEKLRDVADRLLREVLDIEVTVRFQRRTYAGRARHDVQRLRVVGIRDDHAGCHHFYVTNVPVEKLAAEDIRATYALRWQVELLFKELKRHYRIDQMPSRKREIVEALLYASILTLIVSRRLLALVRKTLAGLADRIPTQRWAALLESASTELLLIVTRPPRELKTLLQRVNATFLHEAVDPIEVGRACSKLSRRVHMPIAVGRFRAKSCRKRARPRLTDHARRSLMTHDPRLDAVEQLGALDVKRYLLGTGWERVSGRRVDVGIFRRPGSDEAEVVLPLSLDFTDVPDAMARAVAEIARVEQRPVAQVLRDLRRPRSDALRPAASPTPALYVGKVDALQGEPGPDGRMQGEVVLAVQVEDAVVKMRFDLDPEEYVVAASAHLGGRYVAVRGVLKRGARVHRLEDASGFAIVGG